MEFFLLILLVLIAASLLYLNSLIQDKFLQRIRTSPIAGLEKEGFEDAGTGSSAATEAGAIDEKQGVIRWLDNQQLYDTFYASLYDKLTQSAKRTQSEVGLMLAEWTKRGEASKTFEVLDGGCGTGVAVATFAKMGVKRVVGMDTSEAMLKQAANVTIPQTTLSEEQKKTIEWRHADLANVQSATGGEFSHACLLYFTLYYFTDKESLFRNLYYWIRPGGKLCIQVVNKHKFDPMLESATPLLGFSLQKYVKERLTKSEVVFDKFKYGGEFDLTDPAAEFRETFRFSDGKVRRHRHTFKMENIDEIIGLAKVAGWKYDAYVDETTVGAEYFYLLFFTHP
jgi:SAM-dependent methyltransferase